MESRYEQTHIHGHKESYRYKHKEGRPGQTNIHGHKEKGEWPGKTQWMDIYRQTESSLYEQKEEWPWGENKDLSQYAWYMDPWAEWMNVYGPYGNRDPFVSSLISQGINLNDLKPRLYRGVDPSNGPDHYSNILADAEKWMRVWKLEVEDLKQGTFYNWLENGKDLDGNDVSKEEALRIIDQINNDNKKQYEERQDRHNENSITAEEMLEIMREDAIKYGDRFTTPAVLDAGGRGRGRLSNDY